MGGHPSRGRGLEVAVRRAPSRRDGGESRWKVDLALLRIDEFLAAELPAREPGFQFDAFIEFKYLTDYWTFPGVRVCDKDPAGGRESIIKDVAKVGRYLTSGACRVGYVVVFEV